MENFQSSSFDDLPYSESEAHGITHAPTDATNVYSVGVSTGGIAEIKLAQICPNAHLIATTIDQQGLDYAQQIIDEQKLGSRIELRLEDITDPLQYIYARLVLHYLTKQQLPIALKEMHRVLKSTGSCFVVVRSTDCSVVAQDTSIVDPETGMTDYEVEYGDPTKRVKRYFHSKESISKFLLEAGFTIASIDQYDEQLYTDFMRKQLSPHSDNVIEVCLTR